MLLAIKPWFPKLSVVCPHRLRACPDRVSLFVGNMADRV
jgi:hypothetical protein